MGKADEQEPTAANISCSSFGQLKDFLTPDPWFLCRIILTGEGEEGRAKKGTHIVTSGMRVYLSPAFCVVGVFVRWLAFSCGGGSLVDTLCVRRAWIGEGEEGRAKKRNACRKVGDAGLPVSCVLCGWRFGEAVALSWMLAVFPNLGSRNENQTFLY